MILKNNVPRYMVVDFRTAEADVHIGNAVLNNGKYIYITNVTETGAIKGVSLESTCFASRRLPVQFRLSLSIFCFNQKLHFHRRTEQALDEVSEF